jgi:hypothetical protein
MTRRSLALVANFHKERRIGRKTANFLGQVQARLHAQGVDFCIEFVLDRPDALTIEQIETAARGIPGSRLHLVDFGNLGSSRTFGVEAARAKVVCFTDGDDFFSFNWFEGALDFFSGRRRGVVLHTQYVVGFDDKQYIRETTQSTDPWFDPLSLAAQWYWSANLAIEADVFASVPIEPYDHARGFGSEDWHWTCNGLAEGIERVALPNTSYFYRVKPERFALGRVGDVIHMASPLFDARRLPPRPPGFAAEPPRVVPPAKGFFEQAREVEPFEVGLSYLRAVEVGAETIRHFRPHTPPIVGSVYRDVVSSGFDEGSAVIFADSQRLPGGLEMAAQLCTAITGAPERGRLYIVDGDREPCQARADGYVIRLGDLRAARLYDDSIDRLIARFLIQTSGLKVFNIVSPRIGSHALSFSRATRGNVARWVNVVCEYGFDALAQTYEELDLFAAAAIASENVALFEKTAIEAGSARGVRLAFSKALETAYVDGVPASIGPEALAWRLPDEGRRPPVRASADTLVLRVGSSSSSTGPDAGLGEPGWLTLDEGQREMARDAREVILFGGDAFLGEKVKAAAPGKPGIRIPGLTIVRLDEPPVRYFTPQVGNMNEALGGGRVPADLAYVGAIGVAGDTFREALERWGDRISVAALVALAVRKARAVGQASVTSFDDDAVVSVSSEDLARLGGARLLREISRQMAEGAAHG